MKTKDKVYATLLFLIFLFSLITNWYRVLSICLVLLIIVMIMDKMGKGIVLRELMALHISFIYLLMPILGYEVYNEYNQLAKTWVRYMSIPEQEYFGYALPANAGFILILCWPLFRKNVSDEGAYLESLIKNARDILTNNFRMSFVLILLGVLSFSFSGFLPVELQFAFFLFYFAAFAGLLYIYFLPNDKRRFPVLMIFGSFIIAEALNSGMFTIIAYMGITLFSFFVMGQRYSFMRKLSFFVIGVVSLFFIQTVKQGYRKTLWKDGYQGNTAILFFTVAQSRLQTNLFENLSDFYFPIYYRTNQGFNLVSVMRRFPNQIQYDEGSNLFISIASSFVPRALWPDKPEAGGKANMKYYAGINIKGWSTNVGPIGEAYASFGVFWGMVYMMLLALFIRGVYYLIFYWSAKIPLLLFWIPVLFYQVTYSAESDTLQILNSVIKSTFFIWILYRFYPRLFGVTKTPYGRMPVNKAAALQ